METLSASSNAIELWTRLDSHMRLCLAKHLKIKASPYSAFSMLPKKSREAIMEYLNNL